MPISFEAGLPRLSPALRVRLHGRSRTPELVLGLSAATISLFFGLSTLAPGSQEEDSGAPMIEMRSAATTSTPPLGARSKVRIIPLDAIPKDRGINS
ncbi:MAG: hypothetical protein NVSMB26_06180 [Beijerinckiaceae bacterium]